MIKSISNSYGPDPGDDATSEEVFGMAKKFEETEGRRPRIMIAEMGQDEQDRRAKVIATVFSGLGFDVDIAPLFQTPEEIALQAAENDVHIVGMICPSAARHKTLLSQLVERLKKLGREDILVIIGGVIPQHDYDYLHRHGADVIFGQETVIPQTAKMLLEKLIT